jgi:hypothetical protein
MLVLMAMLMLTTFTAGQQANDNACPTISVNGPSGIIKPGEIATYTVQIDARGLSITPSYAWKVSAGSIVSGQGTERIEVRNPTGWTTTVQVEVDGLPLGCPNVDSLTITNGEGNLPLARKIAEFIGPLTRANFDGIVGAAKKEPSSQLFVILSGTTRSTRQAIARKRTAITNGIARQLDQGVGRVTFIESTRRDDRTVIWLVPPGATTPLP